MKVLILGGTRFIGRHLATEAMTQGHALTLFNAGGGDLAADPRGEQLDSLGALTEGSWDVCIDLSAHPVEQQRELADVLESRVGHYVFLSSLDAHLPDCVGEGSALCDHGALKRGIEGLLSARFEGRLAVLRPGLAIGPGDGAGPFTYWIDRALAGGEFLAPAPADSPVQVVDARDVARFAIEAAARGLTGAFDLVADERLTFGRLLDLLVREAGELSSAAWVDNGFLLERGLEPLGDIPLWLTEEGPRTASSVDTTTATSAGFDPRPLESTLRDTLEWFAGRASRGHAALGGLERERERTLLAEWHQHTALARPTLAAGHEI